MVGAIRLERCADNARYTRAASSESAVHAIICRETRRHAPGEVLAVLQADPEARLKERGYLPANVATAHHNAIAGGMNGAR
jgi:hypothetical protein